MGFVSHARITLLPQETTFQHEMRLNFLGLNIKVIGIYLNVIDGSGQQSPTLFDLQPPKHRGADAKYRMPTVLGLAFPSGFHKPLRSGLGNTTSPQTSFWCRPLSPAHGFRAACCLWHLLMLFLAAAYQPERAQYGIPSITLLAGEIFVFGFLPQSH